MSFLGYLKKAFSSKSNSKPSEILKNYLDIYELEGWEKPYLTKFRESNSPKFTLLKDKFNNIDEFSFNFDLQSNEKQIQLKIDFFDEDILKFSSINSLKKSKLNLNDIIPLEISPNLKSEFVFENQTESIEIFSKLIQKFRISVKKNPFCIEILNKNNEKIIGLNSRNCLNSSKNPSIDFDFEHEFLFGIPERAEKFLLSDTSNGNPYRLYNLDRFGYDLFNRSGLYGSIPLLIGQYPNKTVAIFWRNSSLTYIDLNVDKITKKSNCFWLSESGDLEFYIIVGLNVDDLFFKIGKLLGFAPLPPYFALGYHHSKWSFNDQKDVEEVDQNFDLNEIPYDVIYLDIDYTDQMKYFTFDLQKFPDPLGLCDALEQKGRKLVTIIDPHIKCQKEYFLYDEGVKNNYFVKNEENQDFRASCWPNSSHWLDFLNKDVENYWASLFAYDKFIYSKSNVHIWNDMNEPAVFGVADNTMPKNLLHKIKTYKGEEITVEHGEIHNLYGFCQARATYKGLIARNEDKNQRSFVLTRSFFAGIQKYAAVWTGDTLTTWPFLKITLPMLLSLSVCGVGFVGADIGGFHIDPPENLHIRWFQSAVVYPYFRGHSTKKSKRREPWLYGKNMMNIIREAIILRYEIIPYIYTLFYEHSTKNIPVLRPLWCVLPEKTSIYGVDDKVMLGDCILSSPILDEKQDKISLENVKEIRWFCFHTLKEVNCSNSLKINEMSYNPLFIKERSILVLWDIKKKGTRDLLKNFHYKLIIVVDKEEKAKGKFYIDDGETFDYSKKNQYIFSEISFDRGFLKYCPKMGEGNFPIQNKIRSIEIVGIKSETDMNLRNFNTNLCFVIESQKISHTTSIKIKTDLEVLKEWNIKIYQ